MVSENEILETQENGDIDIPLKPKSIVGIGTLVGAIFGGISYSVPLYFFRLSACGYPDAPIRSFFPLGAIFGAVCVLFISAVFVYKSTEKKKAAILGVSAGCTVAIIISFGCCAFTSIPDCR